MEKGLFWVQFFALIFFYAHSERPIYLFDSKIVDKVLNDFKWSIIARIDSNRAVANIWNIEMVQ